MRKRKLVGMAYAKPLADWGGVDKSPCICSDISKFYSQYQLYPMAIEIYETRTI